MRNFAIALLTGLCLLAGCKNPQTAAGTAITYAAVQSDVTLAYTAIAASANVIVAGGKLPAADRTKVEAALKVAGDEVQAFGTTAPPATMAAALVDLQTLVAALPAGTLSTDAKVALAVAQGTWATYQATRPATGA